MDNYGSEQARVAFLRVYAAHADHPHAPEICRKARAEIMLLDLFAESAPVDDEPPPVVVELEPVAAPAPEPIAEPPAVDSRQVSLFGDGELQEVAPIAEPAQSIYVHFEDLADLESFGRLIGMPVTTQTRLIKFPIDQNHFKAWREQNGEG